jgi:hypothetical protein
MCDGMDSTIAVVKLAYRELTRRYRVSVLTETH